MPNPELLKTASRIYQKGFEIKNRLLMPFTTVEGDVTLYVLKQNNAVNALKRFTLLATVRNFGQDVESTQFRNRPYFEVAETESIFGEDENKPFGEIVGVATHLAVVPNGEMFAIDQGDETAIIQTEFTYKIFAYLTGEKFNLAADV